MISIGLSRIHHRGVRWTEATLISSISAAALAEKPCCISAFLLQGLSTLRYNTLPAFSFIKQSADAEIYGLDLELDVLLTDDDRLGLKAQYLHAEYVDAQFLVARPAE